MLTRRGVIHTMTSSNSAQTSSTNPQRYWPKKIEKGFLALTFNLESFTLVVTESQRILSYLIPGMIWSFSKSGDFDEFGLFLTIF